MVQIEKIQMTEEDLKDKKLQLAYCKLQKDKSDLNLEEKEEQLNVGLANELLKDDINQIKSKIEKKIIFDKFGKEIPATETDLERMKITLNKFEKTLKLDLPSRRIRYEINQLRTSKEALDAPENQIKKLEKEVREKAFEQVAKEKTTMCD